ncbi:hypothetical protein Pcinc_002375 [Petrolisthes cinctipes]|uniref:Uncharacterized protein n=1 Tax=Petrolisthes cinctipes TaxID=88211 RepID=A0AAE1GL40_PETCI|nr:hypothetical protein Pcinc_002375 [Petrolisthes cinctipes]
MHKGQALLEAAARGDHHLVPVLVASGAQMDDLGDGSRTPLHEAAAAGHWKVVVALLKEGANIEAVSTKDEERRALHLASCNENVEVVRHLLEARPDLNAQDITGFSPLHLASWKGNAEIVRLLLHAGSQIDLRAMCNLQPIHRAALWGKVEALHALLDGGADIEAKANSDLQPLHYAGLRGHINVLEALVDHGCNLQARDVSGATVLHYAAMGGHLETVQWLVAREIPHNISDYRQITPEDKAQIYGFPHVKWWLYKQSASALPSQHTQITLCLEEYERIGQMTVEWAEEGKHSTISHQATTRPWRINYQDKQGWSLLHHAAYHNMKKTVETLVDLGACKLARTFQGHTPADLAHSRCHTEVANLLDISPPDLSRGERVKLFGQLLTAISCAVRLKRSLDPVMEVSRLLMQGAPLQPVGGYTVYPLHLAIGGSCTDLLPLLLGAGAPLTTTTGGLGVLQQAWLSPDVTTNVAAIITRAVVNRLEYEKSLVALEEMKDKQSTTTTTSLLEGISYLLEGLKGRQPWRVTWPALHKNTSRAFGSFTVSSAPESKQSSLQSHTRNKMDLKCDKNFLNSTKIDMKNPADHRKRLLEECEAERIENLHNKNEYLTNLLVRACELGTTLTASFLVRSGASTASSRTVSGQTALHAALESGQLDTAATLVRHLGANIFLQDAQRRLPITLAPAPFGETLLEDTVTQDYRVLDYLVTKAKNNKEKEKLIHVVLIFSLLYTTEKFMHTINKHHIDERECAHLESDKRGQHQVPEIHTQEREGRNRIEFTQRVISKGKNELISKEEESCSKDETTTRHEYYNTTSKLKEESRAVTTPPSLRAKYRGNMIWKCCFVRLVSAFGLDGNSGKVAVCDSWLRELMSCLQREEEGEHFSSKGYVDKKEFKGIIRDSLCDKAGKEKEKTKYANLSENNDGILKKYGQNEEELFFLFLEKLLEVFETRKGTNTYDELSVTSVKLIDETLLRAFQVACENDLFCLTHLVLTVGELGIDTTVEKVSGSTALHVAASHGRLGICNFLLSNGASTRILDHAGRTPAHLAYMFGHYEAGDFLVPGVEEVRDRANSRPRELLASYKQYVNTYTLDAKLRVKDQEQNVPKALIQAHLAHLKQSWRGEIEKAVRKLHVNFTKGEAREVKETLTNELQRLLKKLEITNPLFASNLNVLGSSADNLRLYAPDEFDCNLVLKNIHGFPGGSLRVTVEKLPDHVAQAKDYTGSLRVTTLNEEHRDYMDSEIFVNLFFDALSTCSVSFQPVDPRLSLILPGIRKTQVGANVSFAWQGLEFPLLLIDVDLVPVLNIPWPAEMERPPLTPSSVNSVQITSTGDGNWRCSFAAVENLIFRELPERRRVVFLACKLLIMSLKVESWATQDIKEQFTYWDGRKFKIPAPAGFILKSAFLREMEEVQDDTLWEPSCLMERMMSVFRRMCKKDDGSKREEDSNSSSSNVHSNINTKCLKTHKYFHGKIKAYFGGECEKATVGFSAPDILRYLESW